MKKMPSIIKKSIKYSFAIVTGASTIVGLWGYTVKDLNSELPWWIWGLILLGVFIVFSFITGLIIHSQKHKPYTTIINGKTVIIKVGNIFSEYGLKVIPFNERFDTQVDDIIIAHNSLNGQMIDNYIANIENLNQAITSAQFVVSYFNPYSKNGVLIYPLGRIIPYDDYLLLSFAHFNRQNQGYIAVGEYEQILSRMWKEIRRVYASKHIVLPLLGAGITTIDGVQNKDYTAMLKCILCTLRSSGFQPEKGITIVLTEETINKIDMNAIKESF